MFSWYQSERRTIGWQSPIIYQGSGEIMPTARETANAGSVGCCVAFLWHEPDSRMAPSYSFRRNEVKEGSIKATSRSYYYIDYKTFIDVVKWKMFKIRKNIEDKLRDVCELYSNILRGIHTLWIGNQNPGLPVPFVQESLLYLGHQRSCGRSCRRRFQMRHMLYDLAR